MEETKKTENGILKILPGGDMEETNKTENEILKILPGGDMEETNKTETQEIDNAGDRYI